MNWIEMWCERKETAQNEKGGHLVFTPLVIARVVDIIFITEKWIISLDWDVL